MTNYQIFLCILGALTATVMGASVWKSLRTRKSNVGDLSIRYIVRQSDNPILFWTNIVVRSTAAVITAAAVLIAVLRAAILD